MPVESPEDRTVEVRPLPPSVDEELLSLYFENKRRSGGGPLVSIKKKGDSAVLVFEEAEGKCSDRVFSCMGRWRNREIITQFFMIILLKSSIESRTGQKNQIITILDTLILILTQHCQVNCWYFDKI